AIRGRCVIHTRGRRWLPVRRRRGNQWPPRIAANLLTRGEERKQLLQLVLARLTAILANFKRFGELDLCARLGAVPVAQLRAKAIGNTPTTGLKTFSHLFPSLNL